MDEKKNHNNFNFYRCPFCLHIPIIKIYSEQGNCYIDVICCKQNNKIPINEFILKYLINILKCPHIKSFDSNNICSNCKKIFCNDCIQIHQKEFVLHRIYDSITYDSICLIHNEKFIGYCLKCTSNLCNQCYKFHNNHNTNLFNDLIFSDEELNKMENDFIQSKKNMENIVEKKEKIINLIPKQYLLLTLEKIESSINAFKNKNNNITSVLMNLFSIYKNSKKNPNYQIIINLKINSNFNHEELKILKENHNYYNSINIFLKTLYFNSIIKNPIFSLKINSHNEISKMKISKLLTEHKSGICFLLILQDKRLSSASYDGYIIIYELSNFNPQIKIPAHFDWIISLNQLKNGFIVSCSRDSSFKIWEIGLTTYKLITTVIGHTSCTDVLIELSNGDYASCSFDKTIKIWRANNENNEMDFKCIKTITYNDALKKLIEIQNCLVNNVFDHSIHFWSIGDYVEVGVIKNIDCWSTNGMVIISPIKFVVGGYKFLHIINAKTKQLESQIFAHDDIIWSVCLLKDGSLLSGGNDKCIRQWDLVNLKVISEKKKAHENGIITILELPDGRIATGSLEQKEIKIWK